MIKTKIIALTMLAFFLSGCSRLAYLDHQSGRDQVKFPRIRVKILETDNLNLKCDGTYRLNCIADDSTSHGYYSVAPLNLKVFGHGLAIMEATGFVLDTGFAKVFISPSRRNSHLYINGKPFRGILEVISSGSRFSVINILNLEDYLQGVLPPEIGRLGQEECEALKAQSVAARTYAYSRLKPNQDKPYDLVNSILDQVYIGIEGEYDLANKAIKETYGEILTYQGDLVNAYYHSTCGGFTEDICNVWDSPRSAYLQSIPDDSFCAWSKLYTWNVSWTPEQLAGFLLNYLAEQRSFKGDSLRIDNIEVLERAPSGRILRLSVKTPQGEYLFFKDQIRWAFRRPNRPDQILPSTNFEIRLRRDQSGKLNEIVAEGRGYGHGVGMCQCGAIGRARTGQKYGEILKKYYAGVDIRKAY